MALFECDKCGSTKEYNDVLTTRVRNGEVVHFDTDDQPVDACQCGEKMRSVKTKEGWGGFVKTAWGGVGNFKKQ